MTATLRFEDKIAVLDLGEDENRFSPEWLDSVDKLLDQALSESAHALVTTATGKFYSNGLDLDWLGANGDKAKFAAGLLARRAVELEQVGASIRSQLTV